jgi:hypothetical protein
MSRPRPFTDLHGFESAQTARPHVLPDRTTTAVGTGSPRPAAEPAGAPASALAERAATVVGA